VELKASMDTPARKLAIKTNVEKKVGFLMNDFDPLAKIPDLFFGFEKMRSKLFKSDITINSIKSKWADHLKNAMELSDEQIYKDQLLTLEDFFKAAAKRCLDEIHFKKDMNDLKNIQLETLLHAFWP
jgi:hypothetical protein